MDIAEGFQIEQPSIFVPWGITRLQLESLFHGRDLERGIDGGYLLRHCRGLSGLILSLGFRFNRAAGTLCEIEAVLGKTHFKVRHSRNKMRCIPLDVQYDEMQAHLEATFGTPAISSPGEGFLNHAWLFPGARIEHYVVEHFGPNEHVLIRKFDWNDRAIVEPGSSLEELAGVRSGDMGPREALNLKRVLEMMELDGRIEVVEPDSLSPAPRVAETWYRFAGTNAIYRFIEYAADRGGKWELVMPEVAPGTVQ